MPLSLHNYDSYGNDRSVNEMLQLPPPMPLSPSPSPSPSPSLWPFVPSTPMQADAPSSTSFFLLSPPPPPLPSSSPSPSPPSAEERVRNGATRLEDEDMQQERDGAEKEDDVPTPSQSLTDFFLAAPSPSLCLPTHGPAKRMRPRYHCDGWAESAAEIATSPLLSKSPTPTLASVSRSNISLPLIPLLDDCNDCKEMVGSRVATTTNAKAARVSLSFRPRMPMRSDDYSPSYLGSFS